jgi:hypothetical protein
MAKLSKVSVLVSGLWNPRIFSPDWVAEIFSKSFGGPIQVEEVEANIDVVRFVISYSHKGVTITPSFQDLTVEVENDFSEGTLIAHANCLLNILEALPETPVEAFTIKIIFEKDDGDHLSLVTPRTNKNSQYIPTRYKIEQENAPPHTLILNISTKTFSYDFHYSFFNFKDLLTAKRHHLIRDNIQTSEGLLT